MCGFHPLRALGAFGDASRMRMTAIPVLLLSAAGCSEQMDEAYPRPKRAPALA